MRLDRCFICFLFAISFQLSHITYAQNDSLSSKRIGFKLLPGITNSRTPHYYNNVSARFTFNFGGQFIYKIKTGNSAIESGIYFTDKGFKQDSVIKEHYTPQGNYKTYHTLNVHAYYFSIPFLYRYELKNFYFSLGPTVEFHTHSKFVDKDTGEIFYDEGWQGIGIIRPGADFNIGADFMLTERLSAFSEVSFHPNGFYSSNLSDWSFYHNYEIGAGLSLRLKK